MSAPDAPCAVCAALAAVIRQQLPGREARTTAAACSGCAALMDVVAPLHEATEGGR